MGGRLSLTARLVLTLTVGATVLWILAAAVTVNILREEIDSAFDTGLQETAQRLLPLAMHGLREAAREGHGDDDGGEIPLLREGGSEYIVYQIRDASGALLLRSHDAPTTALTETVQPGFATSNNLRVYTEGTRDGTFLIQVAESLDHRQKSLLESATALFLPLALLIPLSALGIGLAVRRGLAPLHELSQEVSTRGAANLAPLEPHVLPVDLRPIAEATDQLIARLRSALEAERAFASNSAHELRTPIAAALAQTQRLIAELGTNPEAARARQVEDALKRVGELSEKLLQLARADAGMAASAVESDLMAAVRLLCRDSASRAGTPERVILEAPAGTQLLAPIDIDAFGIAFRNLLDNAIAHGSPEEPVKVSVGEKWVAVTNGGPAITPDVLEALKRRFVRGQTHSSGSGLGLAIAETIMAQVGGEVRLSSPAPGRQDGFEARLVFPRA
ncbi:two-component sensor histidine kinase [Youhaiella tibetensis]|uniref:histidine kinase n=1 Tax=Paradevosia tibetensis TaxID=1447062 RepID=A0A5B9DRC4_9HYPH|nr:ATP-binding protein [Youhaiella tibetensis]QEE21981.1 two-component sensor histidine kinase [Youhaiella tibetensis]GGF46428.1 two-component sensor histidine kinase [Youhaiella tibetensis]